MLFSTITSSQDDVHRVSHVRGIHTNKPCSEGWFFSGSSCYRREKADPQANYEDARRICRSFRGSSDLLRLNDEREEAWIVHHSSNPAADEYIGLKSVGDNLINVDGSSPEYEPRLQDNMNSETACVKVKERGGSENFDTIECTERLPRVICEDRLHYCVPPPCPEEWFGLDDYCYFYVSLPATWTDADATCTTLLPGSRLATVPDINTWLILTKVFSFRDATVWLGASDRDSEGDWVTVDGTVELTLPWGSRQPDNYGGGEDCLEVLTSGDILNDVNCNAERPFLCRYSYIKS